MIDIGTNYSLSVLFAHMRFPGARIIAAEPILRLAGYIRRNAETNGVRDLTLFEGFVGQSVGDAFPFHMLEHSTQDSRVVSPGRSGRKRR
jgi:FkbM family methyltransferase